MPSRRFTSAQVVVIVVAVCAAVVAIPVGVRASSTGSSVNLTDPRNASNRARVNARGQLQVTGSTSIVGTPNVKVGNFPATQNVAGTVSVGNLPATQAVSGTVNVGNLPSTQDVSGTVAVSNFPSTQVVSGTVNTAATTDQLFGGLMCGVGQPSDVFINVSAYSTLRVYLINQTGNTQGLNVNASIPAAGGGSGTNSYTVAGGSLTTFQSLTQVIDVPAKVIELTCTGSSTNAVEVGLFGRP